jgi:hypothetical protein
MYLDIKMKGDPPRLHDFDNIIISDVESLIIARSISDRDIDIMKFAMSVNNDDIIKYESVICSLKELSYLWNYTVEMIIYLNETCPEKLKRSYVNSHTNLETNNMEIEEYLVRNKWNMYYIFIHKLRNDVTNISV